jgi:hypothetical protein
VHAVGVTGDRDAEEEVKVAYVRHGKLKAEGGGDLVKKPRQVCDENDIVDV